METACASLPYPPSPPPRFYPFPTGTHAHLHIHTLARHAHAHTHSCVHQTALIFLLLSLSPHSHFLLFFPRKPHFPCSLSLRRHFSFNFVIPFSFKLSNQCAVLFFVCSLIFFFAPLFFFSNKRKISKTFTNLQNLNGNYILPSPSASKFSLSFIDFSHLP